MKSLAALLFFTGVFVSKLAWAQNAARETSAIIEELTSEIEDEESAEDLIETLMSLLENPINLNDASRDELNDLFFLLPQQIEDFLNYREKYGKLLSIYELALIKSFDERTIKRLEPFVSIEETGDYKGKFVKHVLNLRVERTLEKKKGFCPQDDPEVARYAGSPYRTALKYRSHRKRDFSVGATAETDPGEQSVWDPKNGQYGPDFLSYHFALENRGIVKAFIVGDYKMDIGQGLSLGHSYSPGKNSLAIQSVRRTHKGLKPYTGNAECNFFRGIAASIDLNGVVISPFFSYKKRDGSLDNKAGIPAAISLPATGLHRTERERSSRNTVGEMVYGGDIRYTTANRRFETGVNIFATGWSVPLAPRPSVWNQFAFKGDKLVNCSWRMNYTYRNYFLFGELAASGFGSFAGISGMQAGLSPGIVFATAYRNYSRDYHAFYASAFNESAVQNEEGFYWAGDIHLKNGLRLNLYYDLFKFHWLKYQIYTPSTGSEFLIRISRDFKDAGAFYFQYKTEEKHRNCEDGQPSIQTKKTRKDQFQLNYDITPWPFLNLRTGVRANLFEEEAGAVAVQDFNFEMGKFRWSSRIALFNAAEYETRLYFYERDTPQSFSFPTYYGRGFRFYSLLEYNMNKRFRIWLRIARSKYSDREEIGSGLETIDGDHKTDLKLQVRYTF